MAKCEKRVVRPEPPPVEYVLTLTEREIAELRAFLFDAADWSANPIAHAVWEAIARAGAP